MVRVLFVTGEYPPMQGGVGDCTHEIAGALAGCGVECHVLTRIDPRAVDCEPGITVHRLAGSWGWGTIPMLGRLAADIRANIVHIQYQTAAFGMHPAINLFPRFESKTYSTVTTFHDLKVPYLFPKAGRVRTSITFELARASDAVIATNEEDYQELSARLHRPVSLIPIGSNIDPTPPPDFDRNAWRARLGLDSSTLLLCYFGFLNESKGAESLIQALAQLPDAKLLMIGGQVGASDPTNAVYLDRVKKLIEDKRLRDRVLWTDYVSQAEVSGYLRASDICVLPYRDGASYRRGSFMAALAHGLPVITTTPRAAAPVSPLPALRDGENVMLVPPDDPEAIIGAVRQLAADPRLRVRLGYGALELAQSFTWDKIAQQHLALYLSLIAA